jgi:fatty acid desaturase
MNAKEIREVLSRDEMKRLSERSNFIGAWSIVSTWGVIFGTLAALAKWPNPATFLVSIVVLGGRQLALSILMHEAAHRTLFRSTFLNDHVANWFCAWPMWNDVALYKKHHLRHHAHTGTSDDPDLSLALEHPMTRRSLRRKIARDLLGMTGLKRVVGQTLIACGVLEYTVANEPKRLPREGRTVPDYLKAGFRNSAGFVGTSAVLAGAAVGSGYAWVLSAWVVAYLTTFSVFLRIRSLAEHACTERTEDPLRNTRTTIAGPLARLTVAPFRVNYHLEHHLLVAVPWFRLPAAHALLRERGIIGRAPGYADVLRLVSARAPTPP